jgi:hypothetical protein
LCHLLQSQLSLQALDSQNLAPDDAAVAGGPAGAVSAGDVPLLPFLTILIAVMLTTVEPAGI